MSAVGLAPLPASNAFSMKVGALYCFFQTQTFGLWKSLRNLLKVAAFYNLPVIKDEYDHQSWREWIKGFEEEPEHGKRCSRCFRYNLLRASKKAEELGISSFCTTLTVSRFKNSKTIFHEGEDLEGFEAIDFKKKDGFASSCRLSKEMGLYRQSYCGCEFSKGSVND